MKQRFTVDHLIYELTISCNNSIHFALVGGANPIYQPVYDPFDWDYTPSVTGDLGNTRQPLRVYREVLTRVHQWVGGQRPKYFQFSALTEKRTRLYRRVAQRLAERFGYDLQVIDGQFLFFKLAEMSEAA